MGDRVFTVSDILRIAASRSTEPLAGSASGRFFNGDDRDEWVDAENSGEGGGICEDEEEEQRDVDVGVLKRMQELEAFITEIFDVVSMVKKAYVGLQEAHSPWEPDRIRAADAGVVSELKKLVRLRHRFRNSAAGCGEAGGNRPAFWESVAPYEAAMDDLRREVKAKEAEIENLKEKLRSGRRGQTTWSKRVRCMSSLGSPAAPTPELFESCMEQVKRASKSFTVQLLSFMRASEWDPIAAARSIIDGGRKGTATEMPAKRCTPEVEWQRTRYALESYMNRKLFHGFENETFYLEGSLTSLLRPAEFRRDCFAQFCDMRAMDPSRLLGILPTCQFGRFAGKKYLAMVDSEMEESLFGGSEQRRAVIAGGHPRTGFYGGFLRLAKAVWLLHLLAFALDPVPTHFVAGTGAEFHPEYMESVVRFTGASVEGAVVGFSVSPGFKLGNGSVVRARVFVIPHGSCL